MNADLVPLALLMGLATYPFRAIPLVSPGFDRLPERLRRYLRLVGPSVLAALAVVNTVVAKDATGHPAIHVGPEWIAVGLCVLVVALRKSLLVGLILAAGSMALLRAIGVAPPP